jgi:hypothetical protein
MVRSSLVMSIDERDHGWRGTTASDVATYLRALTAEAYPIDQTIEARCACDNGRFFLEVDQHEGAGQITCSEPMHFVCRCGCDVFDIVVGRCTIYGEGNWVTIGVRCVGCGVLGSPVDWKSYRGPLPTGDMDS